MAYLAGVVFSLGQDPVVVDVGTREPRVPVDVTAAEVASHAPAGVESVLSTDDRGTAVAAMGDALSRYISSCDDVAGIVGIGGGGGTSIITAGMRALPLGLPKLRGATLASGDVAPFVDVSDITMMPAVTDLAGLNRLSRTILHNAGTAITGMCSHPLVASENKPALGLTMFGVTTDAVSAITDQLKSEYDCLVFHATGTGGRAMEKLADSGMLVGVLDITTTEICDLLLGGVLSAGEDRLDVIVRLKLPYIGSVGALDMVNFWAMDAVPERYRNRLLHPHNPNVTLMRTTIEECRRVGQWIGNKLNRMEGAVRFLIPEKGVSALDREGAPFYDPDADAALFTAIEDTVEWNRDRSLIRLNCHINDPEFARAAVSAFREIAT